METGVGCTCFDMSLLRHLLAGAAVVVSGRPLGSSVTAQGRQDSGRGEGGGDSEEELEGGRRVMRKCRKREREVGRAKGGASEGPLSQRCVQVWLVMAMRYRLCCSFPHMPIGFIADLIYCSFPHTLLGVCRCGSRWLVHSVSAQPHRCALILY